MSQVWQSASLVATYLESVRGAVPLAAEQIDVMLRLIQPRSERSSTWVAATVSSQPRS